MKRWISIAVLFVAAGCSSRQWKSEAEVNQVWPAAQVRSLELDSVNGRVEIEASSAPEVRLSARVKARGRRKIDAKNVIEFNLTDGHLEIEERRRTKKLIFIPMLQDQLEIDYSITLPPSTLVTVDHVNGRIEVKGVDGKLDLENVNGRIEVSTMKAPVSARTVNGKIEVTFLEQFRGAKFKTVNGSVTITVPRGSSVACNVQQVNGSFRSDFPVKLNSSSSHETDSVLNGGEYALDVTTVNGSVALKQLESPAPAAPAPAGQ